MKSIIATVLCVLAVNSMASPVTEFDQGAYLSCSENALAAMTIIESESGKSDQAKDFIRANFPSREKTILNLSKMGQEYRGSDMHLGFQEVQQFLAGVCYAKYQSNTSN